MTNFKENIEIFGLKQVNQQQLYTQSLNRSLRDVEIPIKKMSSSPVLYLKSFYNRIMNGVLCNVKSGIIEEEEPKCEMYRVYEKNVADNIKMLFDNQKSEKDGLTKHLEKNSKKVKEGKETNNLRKTLKSRLKNLSENYCSFASKIKFN